MAMRKTKRFVRNMAVCGGLTLALTGCAETIIAGLTISELFTAGSIVSSIVSGKGFGEHALDIVTGQDCRILDAIFRKDRAICEPKGSVATNDDFKGLIALLDSPAGEQIQLADIPMGPDQYPEVNENAKNAAPKLLATLTSKHLVPSHVVTAADSKRIMHLTNATFKFNNQFVASAKMDVMDTSQPVEKQDLRKRLTRDLF